MRRLHVFFFTLALTISVLITLAAVSWYYAFTAPTYYDDTWMGQMWGPHMGTNQNNWGMGGMMGDGTYSNGYGRTPSYLWIIPVVLIAIIATAIIGVSFYIAYPELKYIRSRGTCNPQVSGPTLNQTYRIPQAQPIPQSNTETPPTSQSVIPFATKNCDVLLKTMTPEEQKVLNVLINHKGKYLQKYIVKESGLSRLKTHRIVARFAQRGIVIVEGFGNTNKIILSDWVTSANNVNPL
jgi:hypothetical protein